MSCIHDVRIRNPIPAVAKTYEGGLLIVGGGKCVWDDYFAAMELIQAEWPIMCVNDIAYQFKVRPITHAVSVHPKLLPPVNIIRHEKSMLEHVTTHSHVHHPGVSYEWPIENVGGTSGLFAVKVAIVMGYTKILLCGIPMDGTGHYFDPPDAKANHTDSFDGMGQLQPWHDAARSKYVQERVRSMSGRTASVLGKPTKEWVVL